MGWRRLCLQKRNLQKLLRNRHQDEQVTEVSNQGYPQTILISARVAGQASARTKAKGSTEGSRQCPHSRQSIARKSIPNYLLKMWISIQPCLAQMISKHPRAHAQPRHKTATSLPRWNCLASIRLSANSIGPSSKASKRSIHEQIETCYLRI